MTTTPLPPLPEPYQEALEPFLAYTAGQMRNYATTARADLEAENARLLDTIDAIYIYANDTLSGRTDGPDGREWQRAAVLDIRNRARKYATVDSAVLARAALKEQP